MKKLIKFILLFALFFFALLPANIYAKSGCCSWHGGVSHCDTSVGRYVCNDSTYSPTCGCVRVTPKPTYTSMPPKSQADLIKEEVSNIKTEYYKNPHWFREALINKLTTSLKASISSVAFYVYTMLPDIK